MALREYFFDDEDETNEPDYTDTYTQLAKMEMEIEARKTNKIFMPPTGHESSLDLYIEVVKEDIPNGIMESETLVKSSRRKSTENSVRQMIVAFH